MELHYNLAIGTFHLICFFIHVVLNNLQLPQCLSSIWLVKPAKSYIQSDLSYIWAGPHVQKYSQVWL